MYTCCTVLCFHVTESKLEGVLNVLHLLLCVWNMQRCTGKISSNLVDRICVSSSQVCIFKGYQ